MFIARTDWLSQSISLQRQQNIFIYLWQSLCVIMKIVGSNYDFQEVELSSSEWTHKSARKNPSKLSFSHSINSPSW